MIRIEQALDHAEGCAEPEVEYERFVRFDINCAGGHGTRGVLLREMHQLAMVSALACAGTICALCNHLRWKTRHERGVAEGDASIGHVEYA